MAIKASFAKIGRTSVPGPKMEPLSVVRSFGRPPSVTPQGAHYKKDVLREDPLAFPGPGFGRTGKSGES